MSYTPQQNAGNGQRQAPWARLTGTGLAWPVAIAVGVLLIVAVCGGFTLLRTPSQPSPTSTVVATGGASVAGLVPGQATAQVGEVVTASGIDTTNRPTKLTNTFGPASTVYAVLQGISVPQGTTLFARWIHDGVVYEDSAAITAAQAYNQGFVEFHMQPLAKKPLATGDYTVRIYVNGNPGPSTRFVVR